MPLSDAAIRKAKPSYKTQRLFDGHGMYLEISPAGGNARWSRWAWNLQVVVLAPVPMATACRVPAMRRTYRASSDCGPGSAPWAIRSA